MSTTRTMSRAATPKPRSSRQRARRRGLGFAKADPVRLIRSVRAGFAFSELLRFQRASALPLDKIARYARIAPRTLTRRQSRGRLNSDESERLLRIVSVFEKAAGLFDGDLEATRQWLDTPQRGLGGETPLEFATMEVGARQVEDLIVRLEHGVFT